MPLSIVFHAATGERPAAAAPCAPARRFRLIPGLLAGALLAAGTAQAQRAEVLHWWTSSGESAAVNELAKAYREAGGTWVDAAVAGGDSARATAISRLVGGQPPTAAQFNLSWQYRDLVAEGLLNNVDAVAAQQRWDAWMPRPIMDNIKFQGHYYAAPVNIHNPMWFWYSKAALRRAGIGAEPATLDEFFAALDKLKAAGLVPLALGGQGWQEFVTFYSVLLAVAGKETYLRFFRDHDPASAGSEPFRRSLATFKRLRGYVDVSAPGRNWNDATALVIAGKAGFQIMGDWAKGEFTRAGQVPGRDYGCFVGFGADAPYVVGGDVFVFPKGAGKGALEAQLKLAGVLTAVPTQLAFNERKGSIPVRADVDTRRMDACAQAGMRALKEPARLVANPDMLMPPDMVGTLQDVLARFWNSSQSVDDVVKALQASLKP